MTTINNTKDCLTWVNTEIVKPSIILSKKLEKHINKGLVKIRTQYVEITDKRFNLSKHFVSNDIRNYIHTNINYEESMSVVVGKTLYEVRLFSKYHNKNKNEQNDEVISYNIERLTNALAILIEMSKWSQCNISSKRVILNLFDVDKQKIFIMNGENITPEHVNSAYTIPCRHLLYDDRMEVVIFRNEEWEKVLFHELIHLFSYDVMSNDYRIDIRLSRIFNVKTKFLLAEAYCEFWARILWCLWKMKGVMSMKKIRKEIDKQRKWSIQQALVVLTNMDIMDNVLGPIIDDDGNRYIERNDGDINTYIIDDKYNTTNNGYGCSMVVKVKHCKETTAAFSYYVITGFLMSEWEEVLLWCCQTNMDIPMRFNNYIKNVWSFITMIREIVNDDDVKNMWNEEEDKLPVDLINKKLTARMTV